MKLRRTINILGEICPQRSLQAEGSVKGLKHKLSSDTKLNPTSDLIIQIWKGETFLHSNNIFMNEFNLEQINEINIGVKINNAGFTKDWVCSPQDDVTRVTDYEVNDSAPHAEVAAWLFFSRNRSSYESFHGFTNKKLMLTCYSLTVDNNG